MASRAGNGKPFHNLSVIQESYSIENTASEAMSRIKTRRSMEPGSAMVDKSSRWNASYGRGNQNLCFVAMQSAVMRHFIYRDFEMGDAALESNMP